MKADLFDEDLVSADRSLKLNVSDDTECYQKMGKLSRENLQTESWSLFIRHRQKHSGTNDSSNHCIERRNSADK